jgi:hypothetical protein
MSMVNTKNLKDALDAVRVRLADALDEIGR